MFLNNQIVKPILLASLIGLTFDLAGCSGAATLGMTPYQWQQLTSAQQQQHLNHYHEIIGNLKQKSSAKEQTTTQTPTINSDAIVDPQINVTVTQGAAAFPNQFTPLLDITPLHVTLDPNTCSQHTLQNANQSKSTSLWFCYINHMVGIDPSFYKLNQAWGTLFININPLWNQGMLYNHLYSSGYVKLNNVSIYIKANSPVILEPKTIDITNQVDEDATNTNTTSPINTLTTLTTDNNHQ